jgi:protocatechuate 3,4-dioxygenase beta subunit
MSTYESKCLARYYLRTVARRSGYLWLVLFLITGLGMADMAQYAGLAEGASTATPTAKLTATASATLTATASVTSTSAATVAATGSISGKILDQGGQPLANIQVLALKQSTATTSSGGYYPTSYSPPPPYDLSIYPPWTPEGIDPLGQGLVSYGVPYPSISGGVPDTSLLYRALSRADGTFLLSDLPEGRYSLWAYDPQGRGFVPAIFGLSNNDALSELLAGTYYPYSSQYVLIKVKSGQTAGPFSMTMSMGGKVSGQLTDADTGLPVKGAIVQASSSGQAASEGYVLPLLTTSDLNGNFTFCGLAKGEVMLYVSEVEKYATSSSAYYPPFEENTFSVQAGQETSGCNLALKRRGTVSGKITSQIDGKPVANAEVAFVMTASGSEIGSYGPYQASTVSGADGTYRIGMLEPGTYIPMVLYAPGFQSVYYPNTRDQKQVKEIHVELGKEVASIDFQLLPKTTTDTGTIRGRIIDRESGLPIAGIQVSLNQVYVSDSDSVVSNPTGGPMLMRNRDGAAASDSTAVNASGSSNTYATAAYATTGYATTAYATTSSTPSSALSSTLSSTPADAPLPAGASSTVTTTITTTADAEPTLMPQAPGNTVVASTTGLPTFISYISSVYPASVPVEPLDYVYVLPPLPDFHYTYISPVQTDQEGRFEFTGLEYGAYSLDTSDPAGWYLYGHYPEYYSTGGYTMLPYIDLSEGQPTPENIEITLTRGGRLEGKVLAGSTPLAGVMVRAIRTSQGNESYSYYPYGYPTTGYYPVGGTTGYPAIAASSGLYGGYSSSNSYYYPSYYIVAGHEIQDMTDTAGEFTICGLEEGEYTLLASESYEFWPQNYADTYCVDSEGKPLTFTITKGSTFTDLGISMKTGASISGKVVDMDGKPMAGISVTAEPDYSSVPAVSEPAGSDPTGTDQYAGSSLSYQSPRYAVTAGDGTYTVSGLSEGVYVLRATDNSESREYQGDCRSGLKVTPPEKIFAPDLVLPKSLILCGKVTSQDGQPLADIHISASLDSSGGYPSSSCENYLRRYGSATTAGDGTYRIIGLAPGNYQLGADDPAGEYLSVDAGTGSSLGLITGGAGEVKTGLDLQLTKGGTIEGSIRDAATGKPISNVTVMAQRERAYGGWQVDSSISSDSEGKYNLHGLSAGKYHVYIADSAGKNYMPQYYPGASSMDEATVLEVNTAQTLENIDFLLSSGIILKGTVKDAVTGQPITLGSGMVTLTDAQGQPVKQAYTSSSGEYKFSGLCPGTYSIQAGDSQYYYAGSYSKVTNEQQKPVSTITISLPGPVEGIDILLAPKGSISGRVVDEFDQKPLANITITPLGAFQASSSNYGYYASASSGFMPSPYPYYQSVPTDANGQYTLKGLVEGDYLIMATDYSHVYGSEYYKDVPIDQQDKAIIIHIGRSESKEGIDMALQVGETYTGADTGSSPTAQYGGMYGSGMYGGLYGASYGYASLASSASAGAYGYAPDPYASYAQPGVGSQPAIAPPQPAAGAAGNIPVPRIVSSNSVDTVTAGRTFTYQVEVNDEAANTPLRYSLNYAPADMNIDPDSGVVQWKPSKSDAGQQIVQLKVDNGSGQVATQSFRLGVEADTTPPEDVTSLKADEGDQKVTLSWEPSANSDGDLADQILYVKEGDEPYGSGTSLGKTTTRYTVEKLQNGQAYTFKVATSDELANESSGVTVTATPARQMPWSTPGPFSPTNFSIGDASLAFLTPSWNLSSINWVWYNPPTAVPLCGFGCGYSSTPPSGGISAFSGVGAVPAIPYWNLTF